ncbi:MAG: cytochrome c [Verrucomicrobiales bacterium]|nr:cytochrome c [Verrucomicrobiales bacterium]
MKRALIFTLTTALSPALAEEVNYSRDIAPVVQESCAGCHREGGGAPFNLTDYESTKRKARTIQRVVEKRYMPPWHATDGDIPLVDDRRLTDGQIELFKKWVEAGRPEGDPADLPAPREYPDGWKLGEPDLVLKMADAYELPADGPDIYRSFVIPTGLKKDRYLKAIEFRPSTPAVVHHSLFSVDTKGRARKADQEDPEPGFAEMPIGEGSGRGIGGWVPGASPRPLPDGLAHHIPAGSDIVLQSHFHLTGKPEREQSEVALYFDSKPPERHFTTIQLPPAFGAFSGIDLAPGESETVVTDSFELPVAVRAFGAHPHSHYRGKSLSMTAHLPDGQSLALLDIPDWDMNWQEEYRFTEEVALPAGTRLEATVVWDNSAESSDNPVVPPVRVRWGLESYDEMGSIDLFVIPEGNRKQSAVALKTLNNAKRDHLVWKAGSHVVGPDKLTVFGKLRNEAIARFDANNDGILGRDERARAKQSLQAVLP